VRSTRRRSRPRPDRYRLDRGPSRADVVPRQRRLAQRTLRRVHSPDFSSNHAIRCVGHINARPSRSAVHEGTCSSPSAGSARRRSPGRLRVHGGVDSPPTPWSRTPLQTRAPAVKVVLAVQDNNGVVISAKPQRHFLRSTSLADFGRTLCRSARALWMTAQRASAARPTPGADDIVPSGELELGAGSRRSTVRRIAPERGTV
jgi:hypothetical protein